MTSSLINMNIDAINMKFSEARTVLSSNANSPLSIAFKDTDAIDHLKHASISSRTEQDVLLRLFTIQSANEALSVTEIAAAALTEQISLVEGIKNFAQDAGLVIKTTDERNMLNQSVKTNLASYASLATNTAFNEAKLLDGSFASYFLFDNNLSTEKLNILIGDTQTSHLGRYVLDTTGSSLTNQVLSPSGTVTTSNSVAVQALTIKSDQLTGDEKEKGLNLSVVSNLSAQGFTNLINQVTTKTGVSASAETHVDIKLGDISASTVFSFNLASGDGATLADYANTQLIEATVTDEADLTALLDQINLVTDKTGIKAEFTSATEKNQIRLTHETGANIQVSNYQSGPYGPDLSLIDSDNDVTSLGESTLNRSAMVAGSVRLESNVSFSIQGDGTNKSIFDNTGFNPSVFHALDKASVEDITAAKLAVSVSEGALVSLSKISEFVTRLKASISDQIALLEKTDQSVDETFEDSRLSDELASLTRDEISTRISSAVLGQAKNITPLALQLI
ncbi:hypothetical protein [Piscirickettsia litoralis]|uniref:Flagellin n=1 Tax=Piscirickettsia litoralis TaxID=1891921 RepID=A0ABX3A8K0_9GAMM|nr:hypothetical protein [Piscirickettsia litoralis]ODN43765.1 hypothetical protein BGC07_13740 [Piscirickettsia litoralis]